MAEIFLLNELAKQAGIDVMYVKRYIALGLVRPAGGSITPSGGFQYFDESVVKRLKKIRRLLKGGCTISQIKYMLDAERE